MTRRRRAACFSILAVAPIRADTRFIALKLTATEEEILKSKTNDMTLKHALQISRRDFTKALIAVPFAARLQQGPLQGRVKIDTERTIGDIDPKIYGNFIEHLGRCIEGGVFEEG